VFVTYQVGAGALRAGRHPTFVQGSDPAAAGEVPLGGARKEGGADKTVTFVVAAFQQTDGRLLWEFKLNAEGELPTVHEKNNLATSSPVTDGQRVYAWFSNGQIVAVDFKGLLLWSRHLGREYSTFDISWGHASSPVLYRDRMILVCYHDGHSYLLALDKGTGKELWRIEKEKGLRSYSTPLVIETKLGPELVVNTSEGVEAFDPATGKQLWQVKEPNRFPIPMPVFHENVLYLSRGYRSGPYMALPFGGRGEIPKTELLWHTETGAPYVSSLVYHDGLLYMATELGIVTCLSAKTGEMIVLRAGRTPQVLARNKLGEQCIASPAVANGKIFIRTDRHLIAIQSASR
jgi:outer membrane protein assembly factor BamB